MGLSLAARCRFHGGEPGVRAVLMREDGHCENCQVVGNDTVITPFGFSQEQIADALGVERDGATYHFSNTARDRDRLRQGSSNRSAGYCVASGDLLVAGTSRPRGSPCAKQSKTPSKAAPSSPAAGVRNI